MGATTLTDRAVVRLLRRVLEHEPGDLTCVVESRMRVSQLQAVLAPHGQRLSLDPPGDPTLGECLLFNLSGPLQHRFGTMRDLVIGVTVVLATHHEELARSVADRLVLLRAGQVVADRAPADVGPLFEAVAE